MRCTALVLVLAAALAHAGDEPAPATPPTSPAPAPVSAPAGDTKAQAKELETRLKAIREQAVKDDPALAKLKTDADEARKHFETAVEDKLKDNVDYKTTKAQLDELRPKGKKDEKHKDAK